MRSTNELPLWDDATILALRPTRPPVDPSRPHAVLVEPERSRQGVIEAVATVFLTNRECPFRCLICDLWKYTTEKRVPIGAIPAQIELALAGVGLAPSIKLYNAGNFFDAQAIPPADLPRIAEQVSNFRTVIIECHPLLVGPRCDEFRSRLTGELQVAMGLETIHPEVLSRLNKRMTRDDFERAVHFLLDHGMPARAFILLRPPFLEEEEGLEWANRSVEWAFSSGVECCAVIPTRAGNGAMEELQRQGFFQPPTLASLERALEHGLALRRGRVFVDLWNIEQLFTCPRCGPARAERLRQMNLEQSVLPKVVCDCEDS